jgi:hypothetical protein
MARLTRSEIMSKCNPEDFVRFLTEIVDPTVKEFEDNPGSVRHAFLACLVTLHSLDYLAYKPGFVSNPPTSS